LNKLSIKSLLSDSVIYGLSSSLAKLIGFLLIPIYTTYLLPEDYAVIAVLQSFTAIITILSILGLDSAVYRFYFENEGESEKVKKINSWIIIQFAITVFFIAVVFLFQNIIFDYVLKSGNLALRKVALIYVAGSLLLGVLSTVINAYFRLHRKPWHALLINIVSTVVSISFAIYFICYLRIGVVGLLYAQVLNLVLVNIFAGVYLFKTFTLKGFRLKENLSMIQYGINILPAGLFSVAFQFLITQIIQYKLSKEELGLFQIGTTFSVILTVITSAIASAWSPYIFSQIKNERLKEILNRVHLLYMLAIGIATITIAIFSIEILTIMTNKNYYSASWVISFQTITVFISSLNIFYVMGISISNKMKFYSILNVASILFTLCLAMLLVNRYRVNGVCISILIGQLLNVFLILYKSEKLLPLFVNVKAILCSVISIISLIFALKLLESNSIFINLTYKILSVVLLIGGSFLFLKRSNNLRFD
jgi:O-antigen/teichoic acid export membrane protein